MPLSRILIFVGVIVLLTAGLHYYLWARLVRDTAWPDPWFRVATIALVIAGASVPIAMIAMRLTPRAVASPIAWFAYSWMGLLFFLFFGVLIRDVVGLLTAASGWIGISTPLDPARRQFFARVAAALVGAGALSLGGFGLASVLSGASVKRIRIPVSRLPKKLSGMRIAQLTDVHVGPTIGHDFIETVVRQTNALDPDVIAITGDLVDGTVEELRAHVAPLAKLRAKHGVFFVTGNHEYYAGADSWIAHLQTLGIRVLRNERVAIETEHGAFDLAGVDDWTAHQFGGDHGADLGKALRDRDPERAVVLLAHQPKQAEEAEKMGVSLQLSGHTHGGQLYPWHYLVLLQQPYVAGLYKRGDMHVYVSCGTGYWGPPMRVGAPAEITLVEMMSPSA